MSDSGICPVCERTYMTPRALKTHLTKKHPEYEQGQLIVMPEQGEKAPEDATPYADGGRPGQGSEIASSSPEAKPPSLVQRIATRRQKPKPDTEGKPGTTRRMKTDELWSDVWAGLGTVLMQTGDLPLGRAVTWTAPVAGEIIEEATRDTFIDRIAQLGARNSKKWVDVADLVRIVGAVGFAERNPAHAQQALTFARPAFVRLLPRIAKKVVAERKKEQEAVEALAVVMPDLSDFIATLPPEQRDAMRADPVGGVFMMMFAPPPEQPAEPEPAVA